jgi:hypothetical protein
MATNTQSETNGRRDEPISGLLRSLFADVSLILRREAELAKIELREKASKAGVGVGLLAAAAWVAALIVSAVLLAVAVGLMLAGRSKLREGAPYAPTRTLETVEEDIGWMRRETDQLKALE